MNYTFHDCQKAIARIYDLHGEVHGAGFLVSPSYLLTCAHVISSALGENSETSPKESFLVDFPISDPRQPIQRRGKVILWFPCPSFFGVESSDKPKFGEDIALIELDKIISPEIIKPVILKPIKDFTDKPRFDAYGFPQGNDSGELTEGKILGLSEIWLQLQGDYETLPVRSGYSGSPIFSKTDRGTGIVGMTVASKYYSGSQDLEKNKAYAIPATALAEVWLIQGQLIEYLKNCDLKWVKQIYERIRPEYWASKQPTKLIEVVTDLYRYWQENPNKQNILLEFVVYLMVKAKFPEAESLRLNLRKWAETAFEVTEEEIAEKCDRLKQSLTAQQVSETANIESRLWIILNEAGTSDQYKIESAYYIKNINNYQRDNKNSYQKIEFELSENIKRSQLQDRDFCFPGLTEIIEQIYVDETLRIDFFLPFKSLDLIADSWLIQDEYGDEPFPIGSEYPVVIRVLERHNKVYKQVPLWESNWKPQYINQLSKSTKFISRSS